MRCRARCATSDSEADQSGDVVTVWVAAFMAEEACGRRCGCEPDQRLPCVAHLKTANLPHVSFRTRRSL
jgi:hypothetical protein